MQEPDSSAFRALLSNNGPRDQLAVLLATGRSIHLKQLEKPKMERAELLRSLYLTEEDSFPFPMTDALLDGLYLSANSRSGQARILMAAMRRHDAEALSDSAAEASLRPIAITGVPAAVEALAAQAGLTCSSPVAFVWLDERNAGIYFLYNGATAFIRDLPFAGSSLADALAGRYTVDDGTAVNIRREEADSFLETSGIPDPQSRVTVGGKTISGEQLFQRMESHLEGLAREIHRSIDYYHHEFRNGQVGSIYLIGGLATMKGMSAYLQRVLGAACEPFDPFANGVQLAAEYGKECADGPAYALAVGAALDRGRKMNLLPGRHRWSYVNAARRRLPLIAAVAAVLLCAGVLYSFFIYEKWLDRLIVQKQAAIAAHGDIAPRLMEVEERMRILEGDRSAVVEWSRLNDSIRARQVDWGGVFGAVASALPDNAMLEKISVRQEAPAKYGAAPPAMKMTLEGRIRGNAADQVKLLDGLLKNLDGSPLLRNAALVRSRSQSDAAGAVRLVFTIAADVREGGQQ